jgi:organic hydroperoxide reductase OsmC/OhrA
VPRLDKPGLARTVAPVAVLCPVSNAARGNVEITVRHQVDEA